MQIDIWSDILCPWCYIGKRRFEAAVEQLDLNETVIIRYRSFELNPEAPKLDSRSLNQILSEKYGLPDTEVVAMQANVIAQAKEVGLDYHLDIAKSGNSFNAHQLLHLAWNQGKQAALKERLMRAYFTEGKAIGDNETLINLAEDVGIDRTMAQLTLIDQTYASAVRHDQQMAQQIGINGVPFFVIDMKYGISGAQPVDVFVQTLQNVKIES